MSETLERKLIIGSAQYNAKPNKEFMDAVKRFRDVNEAHIIILPTTGKNINEDVLHPDFQQFEVVTTKKIINSNLKLQNLQIRSNQINPLTGVQHFARDDRSLIFGSPKQALMYISNHEKSFPKALTTTGSFTHPNYNERGRINEIARKDHEYGFIYVEVEDNKHFHFRHIKSLKNGKFNDLTGYYTKKKFNPQPLTEAMVIGDIHAYELDETHKHNTFKQIQKLKPKHLFLHDVFDGYSINHWIKNHSIKTQIAYDKQGLNLEEELLLTGKIINEYAKTNGLRGDVNIVYSNHDDRLYRWLDAGEFVHDKGNSKLGAELYLASLKGENPVETGIRMMVELKPNIKFLKQGDSYKIGGLELALHGHEKVKGANSSPRSIENALGKSGTAHRHTAYKIRNTYSVGTSTKLDLDYIKGSLGNWTQTNGALYINSQFQLINTINGRSEIER